MLKSQAALNKFTELLVLVLLVVLLGQVYSQEPVHCNDEGDVISRQSNRGENDHHGDQACLWYTSRSDASCSGCDA